MTWRKAILAVVLVAAAAGAEGLRIGNWPSTTTVAGAVAVSNLPAVQTTAAVPVASATMTTTVAISTTSVQVAPANANRRGLMLYNNSSTTVYIAYDVVASTTHVTFPIASLTTWTMPMPVYLGAIAAVRAATGDGKILSTELM